jgi:hypothetical protein
MRKTILRLALLGTAAGLAAGPALAQTSPATPDRSRPPAATEGSTRPGTVAPTPATPVPGRADSVRPGAPDQGAAAGQGTTQGVPRNDTATGSTTTTTTGTQGPTGGNSALTVDPGTRRGPLEAGANSFTEGQARSRIEEAGFTNIEGLTKDGNGIWRGRAMQNGRQLDVGLDYRGNVGPIR